MNIRPSILMLALLASGCASTHDAPAVRPSAEAVGNVEVARAETKGAKAAQSAIAKASLPVAGGVEKVEAMAPTPVASNTRVFPGNDQLFNRNVGPKVDPVLAGGDKVALNFESVSVSSLASALLGDLLQLNYTIDAGGDTMVSLHTRQPLQRNQVLDVLDAVLLPHDLAIVRDNAGVYHVTKRAVTVGSRPVVGSARFKDLAGAGTVIVPLNHIAAGEMAKILTPIAPKEAIVYVDALRNLLVLQGSKAQLGGWLEMVEAFDVDFLSGMSLGVFVMENTSVSTVRDALQAMLGADGGSSDPYSSAVGTSTGSRSATSTGLVGGGQSAASSAAPVAISSNPLQGLVRLFALERLNALVVVTPRSQILTQVETWIRRLDRPSDALETGLFVYSVQNGSASHLADMLNGLFGADGSRGRTGVASGSAPTQFAASGGAGGSVSANRTTSTVASSSSSSSSPSLPGAGVNTPGNNNVQSSVTQLEGNVRVVADPKRNALLIRAPRSEYRRIEKALRELDKAPAQVLIEASIVEVSLTGNLAYGVEWYVQNSLSNGREGQALLNMNSSGDIGAKQPGFSYTIVNKAGAVKATLNALAEKSQVRLLSNPSVLVLDNHNATIQVGRQQPVKSSTTVTTGNLVTEAITYKDTGVMLSVTPTVNASGLITLDIVQQVTDVGEIDAATQQRNFLTRQIQSKVAVRSGEPIVLGGLIRENSTEGRSGVPGVSDIPLLGALFSTTTNKRDRTELLVLMTPRAIEEEDDLRAVSAEMRQRMRAISSESPLPAVNAGVRR